MEKLIKYCLGRNWKVELPVFPENSGWDYGVDALINGKIIDYKSFDLREDAESKTFNSPAYTGRDRNDNALTELLIFGCVESPLKKWEAAFFQNVKKSHYALPPFFWKHEVMSFDLLDRHLDRKGNSTIKVD
jgi:hypothetical protein